MILRRLTEHYDRLAGNSSTAPQMAHPGFSWQKMSFCVVLNSDGSLQAFQSLLEPAGKKFLPKELLVPGDAKPSGSGLNPGLLWDNSAYMLGFKTDDQNADRTRQSFASFRARHLELEGEIDHPWFHAVCIFLSKWSARDAEDHADRLKDLTQNFGVFRIAGEQQYVHQAISFSMPAKTESFLGTCLVTGKEHVPIARLHEPKIKGVKGSQTSGALLVSFNEDAYESLGKTQSLNGPVSEEATFKYANTLNHLLGRKERRILLGDATVIFWAERSTGMEDLLSDLFGNESLQSSSEATPEDSERLRQTRQFLTQVREGTETTTAIDAEDRTRFFILGLSPNNARLSVRFWIETDVAELSRRLQEHLRDTALFDPRHDSPPSLRQMVAATGRAELQQGRFKGFDSENVSPLLAGALARAVLTGGSYPQALLATMLNRIRADGVAHYYRCSMIRGCLVRNSRLRGIPKEVSVALDLNQTEPAYNVGRLFALLEKIQTDSVEGELNVTIKDRYFSSASVTPAVVFPRLLRLSQHHMAKLGTGTKIYYEKLLGEVMSKLNAFPRHLPVEEQGQFAIGYFHQRQDLFKSKKSETKGEPTQ